MKKNIFSLFGELGRRIFRARERLPHVSDRSTLQELTAHYPDFLAFLDQRYRIAATKQEMGMSLQAFTEQRTLPPARILFMEWQLAARLQTVTTLSPQEAQRLLAREPQTRVIDVRESWEWKSGALPGARALDGRYWNELEKDLPRSAPVLVYCHFGVRSLDAALSLSSRGFTRIFTLQGGIDAWSQHVDPSIPRYTGSYC